MRSLNPFRAVLKRRYEGPTCWWTEIWVVVAYRGST